MTQDVLIKMELNKIYNMDCFDGFKYIDDNSVDLIITDPPYNINYYSNFGTKEYKNNIQDAKIWDNNFDTEKYVKECLRIAKYNTFILIFGCQNNIKLMMELGCYRILLWNKNHTGMGDLNDFGIGYEYIFYFRKGKPKLKYRINGIINCEKFVSFNKRLHPTQKPIELFKILIDVCSNEGDLIFDGCIGSGSSMIAAKILNRRYIGFENNLKYFLLSQKRLNNTEPNKSLLDY
jgi:site-specific DNA-methyltransferase (adenine-specific)